MSRHPFLTHQERQQSDRDASLARRLLWLYGPDQAMRIVNGEDPRAEADVAAWDNMRQDRSHGR